MSPSSCDPCPETGAKPFHRVQADALTSSALARCTIFWAIPALNAWTRVFFNAFLTFQADHRARWACRMARDQIRPGRDDE
jgi:hypothetical protein